MNINWPNMALFAVVLLILWLLTTLHPLCSELNFNTGNDEYYRTKAFIAGQCRM
jgi:hypothetical protein